MAPETVELIRRRNRNRQPLNYIGNRTMNGKQIIGFIIGALVVTFGFWLGETDFTKRGDDLVFWYVETILGGIAGIFLSKLITFEKEVGQ